MLKNVFLGLWVSVGLVWGPRCFGTEPVEIFFQEKYRRLDHPDYLTQRLEQEVMRVAKAGEMTTVLAAERADAPAYSFFRAYSRMFVHPETGDTAFFGRHQWLNRGEWTLFILKADGRLWMPFPYAEDLPLSGTEEIAAAQREAVVTVIKPSELKCTIIRDGKAPKQRSPKKIFDVFHRDLAWIPGTQHLLYVGVKRIYVLDPTRLEIHERNTPSLQVGTFSGLDHFNVSGGHRSGAHLFLYHQSGVYRIEWTGFLTKLFTPTGGAASREVFQKTITHPGSLDSDTKFQALYDGTFFLIGNQVFNWRGERVHLINTKQSQVAFGVTQPLMAVSHRKLKQLKIIHLETGTVATVKLDKRPVRSLSVGDDGRFVSVQYQSKYPLAPIDFDVFRIDGTSLTKVASDVVSGSDPAIFGGTVFYQKGRKFIVLPIGGTPQQWGPFESNLQAWSLKVGNEIVYTTAPTADLEGIKRYNELKGGPPEISPLGFTNSAGPTVKRPSGYGIGF